MCSLHSPLACWDEKLQYHGTYAQSGRSEYEVVPRPRLDLHLPKFVHLATRGSEQHVKARGGTQQQLDRRRWVREWRDVKLT